MWCWPHWTGTPSERGSRQVRGLAHSHAEAAPAGLDPEAGRCWDLLGGRGLLGVEEPSEGLLRVPLPEVGEPQERKTGGDSRAPEGTQVRTDRVGGRPAGCVVLDCEGGCAGPREGRLGRQHARADGFFASWGWEGALEGGPGLQLGLGDPLIPGPHAMVGEGGGCT